MYVLGELDSGVVSYNWMTHYILQKKLEKEFQMLFLQQRNNRHLKGQCVFTDLHIMQCLYKFYFTAREPRGLYLPSMFQATQLHP